MGYCMPTAYRTVSQSEKTFTSAISIGGSFNESLVTCNIYEVFRVEARVGIEPTYKGFADLSLTTWVPRQLNNYCVLLSCYCTLNLHTVGLR